MTTLPNFIGIGGQKCASTWLSECLRSHPDVYMSSPKELRYFADNESKGLDWYLGYFEDAGGYSCRGEFASNYIYFPEAAEKIKKTLGDVKIIAVVREPVERALSHIKHLIRDGDLPPMEGEISKEQLDDIIKKHPRVLSNSCYSEGLSEYRSVFGENSVFTVSQTACKEKPQTVLASLWSFLSVNPQVRVAEAEQVVSSGVNPRFYWLEKTRACIFSFAKYRCPWLINWAKKIGVSSAYRRINRGRSLSLSQEAQNYIANYCMQDWRMTKSFFSVD